MKTVRLALAAAVIAFLAVVVPTPAQAYPGLTCNISDVDNAEDGEDFTVTATVDPDLPSDWELTYDGQSHSDTNTNSTTATFEATEDDHTVVAVVTQGGNSSTCVGRVHFGDDDDDDEGDDDGDGGGILPNTGGERLLWLIIGGLLVMTGGGVVMASRRRDA